MEHCGGLCSFSISLSMFTLSSSSPGPKLTTNQALSMSRLRTVHVRSSSCPMQFRENLLSQSDAVVPLSLLEGPGIVGVSKNHPTPEPSTAENPRGIDPGGRLRSKTRAAFVSGRRPGPSPETDRALQGLCHPKNRALLEFTYSLGRRKKRD